MGTPFSPTRLFNIRRIRKARRLFKQQPLFAYVLMCANYKEYSYLNFLDDLRYRKAPKKRKGKTALNRYGRYNRIQQLMERYRETGNLDHAIAAKRLRDLLTKPYRVWYRCEGVTVEVCFSPLVPLIQIENLVLRLKAVHSEHEAQALVSEFGSTVNIL
ncbi:hypothetical protein D3C81_1403610 [compost metagenome]